MLRKSNAEQDASLKKLWFKSIYDDHELNTDGLLRLMKLIIEKYSEEKPEILNILGKKDDKWFI